jgi:hypothetical protein
LYSTKIHFFNLFMLKKRILINLKKKKQEKCKELMFYK